MKALILGGARSGKSAYAENLARTLSRSGGHLHYVATAMALDEEMVARIAHHQRQRGAGWQLHEEPRELAALLANFKAEDVVLVDCLTLWLNNWICQFSDSCSNELLEGKISELCAAVVECPAQLIFVSNEVGMGIVPLGKVSRYFVDNAGRTHQALAKICDNVTFVAAGLPMSLKASSV